MAFFEDLTKKTKDLAYVAADKAKDVAAVAADKAKDAAELTRISMAIAGEQRGDRQELPHHRRVVRQRVRGGDPRRRPGPGRGRQHL